MTIQITIIRIEAYGQWTLRLGSDREAALQMLQARIYYDIQRLFSEVDCLVYANRYDEYFAISTGLSVKKHLTIQKELETIYSTLNISMAIGTGETAFDANLSAYNSRKQALALDKSGKIFGRRPPRMLTRDFRQNNNTRENEFVRIMHLDVNNSAEISSNLSPYEVTALVSKIFLGLSQEFLKRGAMTFFIGGDNFMVISNGTSKREAAKIIQKVTDEIEVLLNCGIGIARTGRKAAEAATMALDIIRAHRSARKSRRLYEIKLI